MRKTKLLLSMLCSGIIAISSFAGISSADSSKLTLNLTTASLSATANTPGKVSVRSEYSCTTNAIRINWNKVSGASGYRIYRWNGKTWANIATIHNGSTTTYRDSGLSSGTLYRYKVKAYKKVGGTNYWGAASNEKYTATKSKAVKITSTSRTKDAVRLNWTKQTGNGYQVYQLKGNSWVKIATLRDMNTVTYRISGLKPGTEYKFKVRAYRTDTKGKVNAGAFGSVSVSTKPAQVSSDVAPEVYEVLSIVNTERKKAGLKELTLDLNICKAAQVRTKEITQVFSHTRPDGTSCFTVLDEFGVKWNSVGENIARGQQTPTAVMNAWMNSEGHRKNILNSSFGKIGIGYDPTTKAWVQLFTN